MGGVRFAFQRKQGRVGMDARGPGVTVAYQFGGDVDLARHEPTDRAPVTVDGANVGRCHVVEREPGQRTSGVRAARLGGFRRIDVGETQLEERASVPDVVGTEQYGVAVEHGEHPADHLLRVERWGQQKQAQHEAEHAAIMKR